MMRHVTRVFSLGVLVFGAGFAFAAESVKVAYGKEQIEISHRINGGEFLVRSFYDERDGSLLWLDHNLRGSFLIRTPVTAGRWDTSKNEEVFTFGKRSFWNPKFNAKEGAFYVLSDEQNDESFNTYRVNFKTGELDKVTDFAYQPTFNFSAKGDSILSVGRKNKSGSDGCLKETALDGKVLATLFCNDDDQSLFGFEQTKEDPKSGLLAFVLATKGDRSRKNLAVMKRGDKTPKILTDKTQKRVTLMPLGWYAGIFYFISNDGAEAPKLNRYTPDADKIELVAEDPIFADLSGSLNEETGTIALNGRSADSKVGKGLLIDLATGKKRTFDTSDWDLFMTWATPAKDGRFVLPGKLRSDGTRLLMFTIDPSLKEDDKLVTLAFERARATAPKPSCDPQLVSYPTFDEDPDTKKTRTIEGVLFKPVTPRSGKAAGIVYAHGGPSGRVTPAAPKEIDFFCELGYTVLAANVRGSTGRGQVFEDLNNGDWGGGDWKDYEYARRFLVSSEKIEADRVGITGGSFGGYMTNWAMTRPDNAFAFGISDYGMADLLLQMKFSVVPDNTKSDMGDPVAKEALYKERSPLFYASNIRKPFLITQGSRDFRVYFEDARVFAKELAKYGKDVRYVELKGEGHGYRYPDTLTTYYEAIARFLYDVAPIAK